MNRISTRPKLPNTAFSMYRILFTSLIIGTAPVAIAQNSQPTLDELLNIAPSPGQSSSKLPDKSLTPQIHDTTDLRHPVDGNPQDAFGLAVDDMSRAANRLRVDQDPGLETQRVQQEILNRLDQVIAAAKSQESNSKGGSSSEASSEASDNDSQKQANSPMAAPAQQAGLSGAADGLQSGGASSAGSGSTEHQQSGLLQENRVEWGNLPPRLRNQLQQGLSERFSAVYQRLTEQYYRQLADQDQ